MYLFFCRVCHMFRKDSFSSRGEISWRSFLLFFSRVSHRCSICVFFFLIEHLRNVESTRQFIYIFIKDHSWCSLFNVNVKLGYKEVSRSLILRQIARFHFCSVKFAERSNFVSSLGELVISSR